MGSGPRRAAEGARDGARSILDWLSDLGQGSWVLVIGVAAVAAVVLAVVMGRGGTSTCDQALKLAGDIRLYDGSVSLQPDATHNLHEDARTLDRLAAPTTGAQRDALIALANDARRARRDQPFQASSSLRSYHDACT